MNIVIVGNGIAGLSAAKEIRKANKEVEIYMVSNEKYLTYYRTQLSHFLAKDFKVEDIYIHSEKWYEENSIKNDLGLEVKKIDIEKNQFFYLIIKNYPTTSCYWQTDPIALSHR